PLSSPLPIFASYIAIFSMTTASFMLASYAGIVIGFKIFGFLRYGSWRIWRAFGLFDWFLCAIIVLWCIAAILDMGSGRVEYCGSFDLSFGMKYTYQTFKMFERGFYYLFVFGAIVAAVSVWRLKIMRIEFLASLLWLLLLGGFYVLVVSKCGAKYYLMSGFFLSMLVVLAFYSALLCVFSIKSNKTRVQGSLIVSAILCFCIASSFTKSYQERPRAAYKELMMYAKSWVTQVQKAQQNGKHKITITIPKALPHWRWQWFMNGFPHTLLRYGIISDHIEVTFAPME
ncbi:hypothetical protein, partial [Helicobacter fennelliae]